MRAAIITLHNVCNYGTQLQAYATQEILKDYYDEVEFINFKRKDTYGIELLKTFTGKNYLKAIPIIPTLVKWKKVFGGFQRRYLNISTKEYLCDNDFLDFSDEYDAYYSGSDQVWNCGWNKGVIPPFYLSFVPDQKNKYAFSSSFGQNKVEEEFVVDSLKYIKRFDYITVREKSGVDILKKQYGYDQASNILDPTLLLDSEYWRQHAPKTLIKDRYILIYNLQRNPKLDLFAENLSKRTGYKLYRFCTRYDQIVRNGKSILIPDIFEFITLIDNAEFVVTDSFHATAFSMNLNTEPICIYPKKYQGRIEEFLALLKEEKRHLNDIDDLDIIDRHVNFEYVNEVLLKERRKARKIIETNLLF